MSPTRTLPVIILRCDRELATADRLRDRIQRFVDRGALRRSTGDGGAK